MAFALGMVNALAAGWYNRRKSHHFEVYLRVAKEFATLLDIDPFFRWPDLFTPGVKAGGDKVNPGNIQVGLEIGSKTSTAAVCTTRSFTVGIPSGLCFPSGFGIHTLRTAWGEYVFSLSSLASPVSSSTSCVSRWWPGPSATTTLLAPSARNAVAAAPTSLGFVFTSAPGMDSTRFGFTSTVFPRRSRSNKLMPSVSVRSSGLPMLYSATI